MVALRKFVFAQNEQLYVVYILTIIVCATILLYFTVYYILYCTCNTCTVLYRKNWTKIVSTVYYLLSVQQIVNSILYTHRHSICFKLYTYSSILNGLIPYSFFLYCLHVHCMYVYCISKSTLYILLLFYKSTPDIFKYQIILSFASTIFLLKNYCAHSAVNWKMLSFNLAIYVFCKNKWNIITQNKMWFFRFWRVVIAAVDRCHCRTSLMTMPLHKQRSHRNEIFISSFFFLGVSLNFLYLLSF